jgi:zinc transport system substrate-binding protein
VRKVFFILSLVLFSACTSRNPESGEKIITVSIAPFKYFVEAIGDSDFTVNVMVPPGANPHIYEPFPKQISMLRKSVAYISNGYLGFEMTWLDRFFDSNRNMKKLSLGVNIEPLGSHHHHDGDHVEGADPHYWVSPRCARQMAGSVEKFLIELNPAHTDLYQTNYKSLLDQINALDEKAVALFSGLPSKSFMIFHPNLGYLARDYGLEEISVEYEGKEPPPSRMKELIDRAKSDHIKTIFVQREYDTKNAKAIANEIGARVLIIDPLSGEWLKETTSIIEELHKSLVESSE